jgi:hypothetical protein
VQVHNFVDRASNTRGGLGCETTTSTGLSRLPTSLLSHCSHGGNSFTAETFVNDDRGSGRRLRRWPERPSLTKVSAVKHAPPCETMDHTRPFQLVLVSRWRGPRLLPENRPGRMILKLLSPILHLLPVGGPINLPIGGPINEIVNLHSNDGAWFHLLTHSRADPGGGCPSVPARRFRTPLYAGDWRALRGACTRVAEGDRAGRMTRRDRDRPGRLCERRLSSTSLAGAGEAPIGANLAPSRQRSAPPLIRRFAPPCNSDLCYDEPIP